MPTPHRPTRAQLCTAVACCVACIIQAAAPRAAHAQRLTGEWVEQNERAIDAARRQDVRVIVLDEAGQPVPDTRVHAQQLTHDFRLAFAAEPDELWPVNPSGRAVWRVFNGVSLDRLTAWRILQPRDAAAWDPAAQTRLDNALTRARLEGLRVAWGGVVSADASRNPDWLIDLDDASRVRWAVRHAADVAQLYGPLVETMDLYTDALNHDALTDAAGPQALRDLYATARLNHPPGRFTARFDGGLDGPRRLDLQQAALALTQSFVDLDAVTVRHAFAGNVSYNALSRALDALSSVGLPLHVDGFEAAGPTPDAAALNLETALRALFAEPAVAGVTFTGVRADEALDPSAALLNDAGQPTPAGQLLDTLFREHWWDASDTTTNPQGATTLRLFRGGHRVTATLPDGRTATTDHYVRPDDREQLIVLQAH